MKHGSTQNAVSDVNTKKWRKWCELFSPFLFNNTYVYLCCQWTPNVLIKYFMIDGAKQGLETWLSPNNDIVICCLDMKHSCTKNAFWEVNNMKWRKLYKFVSFFLFNSTYGLTVHRKNTKSPNKVFYVWMVDLQTICDN
jgi:hypothetical protein